MTELSDREAELVSAHEQERPARHLGGALRLGVWIVGGLLSVYSLVVVFRPVEALEHRMTFLAVALPLVFLCYRSGLSSWVSRLRREPAMVAAADEAGPPAGARTERPTVADWLLAAAALAVLVYPLADIDAFRDRGSGAALTGLDIVAGLALTVLLLEAVRRTVGWALTIICLIFLDLCLLRGISAD